MRIWIFSDWHLEHYRVSDKRVTEAGFPDADICVVPGDMHHGDQEVKFLGETISDKMPVIMTPGNHSFYNRFMSDTRAEMARIAADFPNLHLLDPGKVVIGGIRFIGATLWTDYDLLGIERRKEVMWKAGSHINDHRYITAGSSTEEPRRFWSPDDARARHLEELAFIESELREPFEGRTIIVSHHGPHPESVHPRFRGAASQTLNGAFVSDLSAVINKYRPALWVHGHIHDSMDYVIGETRIVANPRGYETLNGAENPVFDPRLVIEIL